MFKLLILDQASLFLHWYMNAYDQPLQIRCHWLLFYWIVVVFMRQSGHFITSVKEVPFTHLSYVGWLVCQHETLMEGGSRPRIDCINFRWWYWIREGSTHFTSISLLLWDGRCFEIFHNFSVNNTWLWWEKLRKLRWRVCTIEHNLMQILDLVSF